MNALTVSIFQSKQIGNCSNDGISDRFDRALLICDEGPNVIDDITDSNLPIVEIVDGYQPGHKRAVVIFDPHKIVYTKKWSMMGGCFIHSCDIRFPADYPVPLHDRYED